MEKILVRIDSVNEKDNLYQYETECSDKLDAIRFYMNYKGKRGYEVIHVSFETVKSLF